MMIMRICFFLGQNGERVSLRQKQHLMIKQSSQDMATNNGAAPDAQPSVVPTTKKTVLPSKEKSTTTKSGKAKDKNPPKDTPPVAPKAADKKRKHGKQTLLQYLQSCTIIE
jgi:hypothetical protein